MSTATRVNRDQIAETLRDVLVSPNVADSNLEAANLVDVVHELAGAVLKASLWLGVGDDRGNVGAIHEHGVRVLDAAETIASAIRDLASAIRETRD